jgi:hypothetical protein
MNRMKLWFVIYVGCFVVCVEQCFLFCSLLRGTRVPNSFLGLILHANFIVGCYVVCDINEENKKFAPQKKFIQLAGIETSLKNREMLREAIGYFFSFFFLNRK